MSNQTLSRRSLFKAAFTASAAMVGASVLHPLYASDDMAFKGPDVPDVDAVKVGSRCYYLPAIGSMPSKDNLGFFCNPSFVVTSEGVVVVDTGSSVQIGEIPLAFLEEIGLIQHLSPNRSTGLYHMIKRIQAEARQRSHKEYKV